MEKVVGIKWLQR